VARYSLVRQNDGSDCGAAALATILRHYEMPIGLEQLRDLTGTDRIGTNLLALLEAAEKLGFSAKGVEGTYEQLQNVPFPAIAHIKKPDGFGHFVVVYRVEARYAVIADPGQTAVRKIKREEFCEQWTGRLLILVPETELKRAAGTSEPRPPWRRFVALLAGHTGVILEAFVLAILVTLLGICSAYFIQHLVDNVLVREEIGLLNALGVGMLIILAFRTIFGILRQYLMARVSRKIDLALVSGYARHVLQLPIKFFEMRRVGEILSRVQDAAHVRNAISGTTLTALVDTTMVLVMAGFLFYHDWPLALVASAFVPVMVFGVAIFHPAVKLKAREGMEHAARVASHLYEDVSGIETVKAFGAERRRSEQGEENLIRMVQTGFTVQKLSIAMGTIGGMVRGLAGLLILWYGGYRVMAGEITLGQLMFFNSMLAYMIQPLERLASVNLGLQQALVSVDRLYQILDVEIEKLRDSKRALFTGLQHEIHLQDVSFKYGCRDYVLKNIDLRIPAGKTVGIVGESGSGKTTLLKLLMGFHEPVEGAVLVDGVDLRDIDLASWRSRIGLVSQDVFIFQGTVRENIGLASPHARLDEITAAAKAAGLHEFVNKLPERYETIIGERGANLSGGERQRLAIARALLHQPEILIFDEATSHLDTATERAVQQALKTVFAGKAVILVAHRLSTIMDSDAIYVMQDGRIVEHGTHKQLLDRFGTYADLWSIQTGAEKQARMANLAAPVNGEGKVALAANAGGET